MKLLAWLIGAAICFAMVQGLGWAWIVVAVPLFAAWTLMLAMMVLAS